MFRLLIFFVFMMLFSSCVEVEHYVYGSKNNTKVRLELYMNHALVEMTDDQSGGDLIGDYADQFRTSGKGVDVKQGKLERNGETYDVITCSFSPNANNFSEYALIFEKDKIIIPTVYDSSDTRNEDVDAYGSFLYADMKYSVFVAKSIFPNATAAFTRRPNGKLREVALTTKDDLYVVKFPMLWLMKGNVNAVVLAK